MFICEKNHSCCDHQFWDRPEDVEQEAKECGHLIEVAPVVHGWWETSRYEDWDGDRVYRHYHRACGCEYDNYLEFGASYCPNCGAKMNGERREG